MVGPLFPVSEVLRVHLEMEHDGVPVDVFLISAEERLPLCLALDISNIISAIAMTPQFNLWESIGLCPRRFESCSSCQMFWGCVYLYESKHGISEARIRKTTKNYLV